MIMLTAAFLLGLIFCLLFGVPYIDFLKKRTIGQFIKSCAPETHVQKQGTPTTGGVFIVTAVIISSVISLMLAQQLTTETFIVLMTLLFYACAGFQDDYLKIQGKVNDGLTPRGKLLRQIAIAILPVLYLMITSDNAVIVNIGRYEINLGLLYPVFAVFVITGSSNAYNLTDGLDGLAAFSGLFAFLACAVISQLSGVYGEALISAAAAGALLGFLRYNKPKAQVFMGDTGSLAIGGLLGTVAVLAKFEFLLIAIGFIFVMETLSVIIQVASFKMTGKRVFKMSPVHHHFELVGWSERNIVLMFGLISAVLSGLAVLCYILTTTGVS